MRTNRLLGNLGRLLFVFAIISNARAAVTDLAGAPLITSAASSVLPNLLFVLDDSGSMDWTYMPDNAGNFSGNYGYSSSQCNGVYYNPAITYAPPVDSTGASYANATFTAAWQNGYNTSAGTVDLSKNFQVDTSAAPAYYYAYSGTQTTAAQQNYYNTSGVFYNECNSSIGSTTKVDGTHAVNTVFTKKVVSATSGPGGSDERQNFANWYSYYRTRIMMMKTAAGLAFKAIDNHYRVGFFTINNNTGSDFLNIATFDSTQKSAWYNKLYSTIAGNSTPLREALSYAGQIYAGKLKSLNNATVTDPVQYSCQKNFAILSTDGFWNGSTTYDLNNNPVGQQDGGEPRPMYDGGSSASTATTPTTTVVRKQTVTTNTTTKGWQRSVVTIGPKGSGGCTSTRYPVITTPQTYNQVVVSTTTSVDDTTTTVNHVVVTSNGVVTSDTTSTPSNSSANVSSSSVTNSDSGVPTSSSWTNGSATTVCKRTPPAAGTTTPSVASITTTPTSSPTVTTLSTTGPTVGATTTTTTASGGTSDTLADVAEYYYKTDLRDASLGNAIGALGTDVSTNNVPGSGQDSASWQHMTTFTLGLGTRGRMVFSPSYPTDTSGDFFAVKSGSKASAAAGTCSWQADGTTCNWPIPGPDQIEAVDDLWHAAVNGRGVYMSATNPAVLAAGLSNALANIKVLTSDSAAATTSNPNVASGDNFVFSSTFTSVEWDGELIRQQIDLTTGVVSATKDWAAQALLDTNTARTIYTYAPGASNKLTSFQLANLASTDQAYFTSPTGLSQFCTTGITCLSAAAQTAASGVNLVNFLGGDRSNEGAATDTSKYYRARTHILGDIVDGEATYVKVPPYTSYADAGYSTFQSTNSARQAMVYVAANDGMLHAFNADLGTESWAYIPSLVLPTLSKLADKNYSALHQYFVDGTPQQGDVYFGSAWHTILVGGLNGGGRGYYALDVTNPASPKALWEFTSDTSKGTGYVTDANLGYSYGKPEITKLKDGTWVVLVTSGYNNVPGSGIGAGDGKGYLYVLNAATGAIIKAIGTGVGGTAAVTGCTTAPCPSGLAQIRSWSDNTAVDNTSTRVYGGDLFGNLWRFDISALTASGGTAPVQLLATLSDASSKVQPITTKPELGSVGGIAVAYIGTGRYLGITDLADTSSQTLYAIKDTLATTASGGLYGNIRATTSGFVKQTITDTTCPAGSPASVCSTGQAVRTVTSNAVNFASDKGWYVDLPDSGERANTDPQLSLGTLALTTNVLAPNACTVGGYSFLNFFNYQTGSAVATAGTVVGIKLGNALATRPVLIRLPNNKVVSLTRLSDGTTVTSNVPIANPASTTRRVSWRELVTD